MDASDDKDKTIVAQTLTNETHVARSVYDLMVRINTIETRLRKLEQKNGEMVTVVIDGKEFEIEKSRVMELLVAS